MRRGREDLAVAAVAAAAGAEVVERRVERGGVGRRARVAVDAGDLEPGLGVALVDVERADVLALVRAELEEAVRVDLLEGPRFRIGVINDVRRHQSNSVVLPREVPVEFPINTSFVFM